MVVHSCLYRIHKKPLNQSEQLFEKLFSISATGVSAPAPSPLLCALTALPFRCCVWYYSEFPALFTTIASCHACPLYTWSQCVALYIYTCVCTVTPFAPVPCALTIAGNECPVVSAVRVQLAAFGRSFAGRSLHEELVFAEGALLSAIQRLALRLERTPGLLSVSLPFTRNERGAVFGFSGRESPERVRLVIPTLRSRRAIIWIHRCHIAVWDARICVHT